MAVPTASSIAKAAIQEIVDLVQVDGLPTDPSERLQTLHLLARSETVILTHCPETGISLDGIDAAKHAASLWPPEVPASRMSPEASEREAALYRVAGTRVPVRRN